MCIRDSLCALEVPGQKKGRVRRPKAGRGGEVMNILLDTIEKLPEMAALRQAVLKENLPCSLARVANGAKQHLARSLSEKRNVFFICATDYEARQRYAQYIYANKILLPAPQIELHPVETRGEETSFERIAALSKLGGEGSVVFLSMDSLLFKMRPAAQFYGRFLTLEQGAIFPPAKLAEALVAMGYEGGPMVESPGQIAGRGEILEVFPPGGKSPWRITFFDDEIESIRPFDADSQRSFGAGEAKIVLPPAVEFCLEEQEKKALSDYLCAHGGSGVEGFRARYLFELSQRGTFANIEAFAGVLPGAASVLEMCIRDRDKGNADERAHAMGQHHGGEGIPFGKSIQHKYDGIKCARKNGQQVAQHAAARDAIDKEDDDADKYDNAGQNIQPPGLLVKENPEEQDDEDGRGKLEDDGVGRGGELIGIDIENHLAKHAEGPEQNLPVEDEFMVRSRHDGGNDDGGNERAAAVDGQRAPGNHL